MDSRTRYARRGEFAARGRTGFLPQDPAQKGLGALKTEAIEKTVRVVNEYFDTERRVTPKEIYTNQFTQL